MMSDEGITAYSELCYAAIMVGASVEHPIVPTRVMAIKAMRLVLAKYPVPAISEMLDDVDPAEGTDLDLFRVFVLESVKISCEPQDLNRIADNLNAITAAMNEMPSQRVH